MTTLVFDTDVHGHHLEYLHHIHEYVAKERVGDKYIFVLPKEFNDVKGTLEWTEARNILFRFLTGLEAAKCNCPSLIKAAWRKSRVLRKYVKEEHADRVLLIMLAQFMPFLPFFMPSKTKVRGIIYRIYLYEWKRISFFKKCQEVLKYWLFARCNSIERPFILNDSSAACYLNNLYKTNKFCYIPDPINITASELKDIRSEIGAGKEQKVHLHFGGLTKRKGTMIILDAINMMPLEELKKHYFVFAGRIYDDIREEFFAKSEQLKKSGVKIKIFDEFCSYDLLKNLCYSCDDILLPYSNTTQSSGVIGYAAYFKKPVIGPKEGLLGKLIRNHKLGHRIVRIDKDCIYGALTINRKIMQNDQYCIYNTISNFTYIMFH